MYDLLIENARICDGTGAPSFHGCVAVKDGPIAVVGNHHGEAAAKTINADGIKATIVSGAVLYQDGE